ncbi:serine/threonine-protein kinase [Nocardioides speluncae]|uniref:serine/threonine-protein kinase n=1 Tax=Nocardioides speluncae TaxID=2670337 RepID=UPI000D692BD5|nr:serine/threonine-protein kinase [Nocardioides speluncae]
MATEHSDSWSLQEGDQLTAELTAMRLLGGGEAYEAYLAFDEITFSPVVVKVLRPNQVSSRSSRRGLRREVRALAAVNHPVVVRGLRHEYDGARPHVVLEHIDGPRLSTLIRRYGALQPQQYLPLAIDVASALHYLRQVDYVHLDIKPSNIIMGAPARLIDLSVARTTDEARELSYPVGTDAYMAPEQCAPPDTGVPGPASDVWGLGATLFEAIAGYRAFDEGDTTAPYELPEQVPGDVAKIVYATLETEPGNRPLPREIAEGLEPALARQPRGRLAGLRGR